MDVVVLLFLALWAVCAIAVYQIVMLAFAILRDLFVCRRPPDGGSRFSGRRDNQRLNPIALRASSSARRPNSLLRLAL